MECREPGQPHSIRRGVPLGRQVQHRREREFQLSHAARRRTAGAQYKWSEALKFDVGAAYIWVQNGSIAQISTSPASVAQFGYVKGDYNNNVVIVSGQLTWSF